MCFLITGVRGEKGFACTSCEREKQQPQSACALHQKLEAWQALVVKCGRGKTFLPFFVLPNLLRRRDCWVLSSKACWASWKVALSCSWKVICSVVKHPQLSWLGFSLALGGIVICARAVLRNRGEATSGVRKTVLESIQFSAFSSEAHSHHPPEPLLLMAFRLLNHSVFPKPSLA